MQVLLKLDKCFILCREIKVSRGTPIRGYQNQKDFAEEWVDVIFLGHGFNVVGDGEEVGLTRVSGAM
jgi:hypothetical protein